MQFLLPTQQSLRGLSVFTLKFALILGTLSAYFLYVHWKLWIGARDGKSVRASIIPTTRASSKVVSDLDIVHVLVVGQVVNAMFGCICQHIDQS